MRHLIKKKKKKKKKKNIYIYIYKSFSTDFLSWHHHQQTKLSVFFQSRMGEYERDDKMRRQHHEPNGKEQIYFDISYAKM
jgi:hypothetical protein